MKSKSAADAGLVVKTIFVDSARVLKRMRPAPQGRGYRVRKRSNHVTLIVDEKDVNRNKDKKEKLKDLKMALGFSNGFK